MSRLIKKYKNRRLYDTEISGYITLDQLQRYVVDGVLFVVEDSETGKDLTNAILLQIIVEMEAGSTQFLSVDILRQIISLANHPMHGAFKSMMESLFQTMNNTLPETYKKTSEAWGKQLHDFMQQWTKLV